MATAQEIYDAIMKYIDDSGIAYNNWYVGIASSPKDRLFTDHNVNEAGGHWIYQDAGSQAAARKIEKFILDTHSTQGGKGGGDETTTWVYAYAITPQTTE